MPGPTAKDLHLVDPILTNLVVGYTVQDFIADKMFRVVPVPERSATFYKFLKGGWFRNIAGYRGPGSPARIAGYNVSSDTLSCKEVALAHKVPIESIQEAMRRGVSAMRPMEVGARFATNAVRLNKEVALSTLVMNSSNWTGSEDVEGAWANTDSTNTFITDVNTAKENIRKRIGRYPNVLEIEAKTFMKLKEASPILDRIKYMGTQGRPADVTTEALAALFELDEVLIGGTIYSDAEETLAGTEFNAVDLWEVTATKGSALLFYRNPSPEPDKEEPSAGYTFQLARNEEVPDATGQDLLTVIRRWWESGMKSWMVEASEIFDQEIVMADAGHLFYDTILT